MAELMNSMVMTAIIAALIGLGLAIIAANWPKFGKPILEAYLKVLQVTAVVLLYGMYYTLLAFVRVIQLVGDKLLKRRAS